MLVKTLILGLISAGAVGTVVYYGTDANLGVVEAENAPTQPSVKLDSSAQDKTRISPKLPTIRKVEPKDTRQKLADSQWVDLDEMRAEAGLTEGTLEAELGDQGADMASLDAGPSDTQVETSPKKQSRWLDQYIKRSHNDTDAAKRNVEAHTLGKPQRAASDSATARITVKIDENIETIEVTDNTQNKEAKSFFRIEDGKLVEIQPNEIEQGEPQPEFIQSADMSPKDHDATDSHHAHKDDMPPKSMEHMSSDPSSKDHKSMEPKSEHDKSHKSEHKTQGSATKSQGSSKDYRNKKAKRIAVKKEMAAKKGKAMVMRPNKTQLAQDSSPIIATVMQEAALIQRAELRDQAYFEITEYALSEGRFESARAAHDLIDQDELAYTAKSRIAVAHAHNGEPTKAFKTIGEVEDEELRDFMRLQVIEALIAPQNLPQGWQKQGWQEKQN